MSLISVAIVLCICLSQINLNAELSRDEDYNDFKQSSPKYVWLCRNFTEPGFNISGDLLSIPVASIPAKRKDFFNQNATKVLSSLLA